MERLFSFSQIKIEIRIPVWMPLSTGAERGSLEVRVNWFGHPFDRLTKRRERERE